VPLVASKAVGWRYYFVFAVCSLSNTLFFWAFLPETRGILLEEVDAYVAKLSLFVLRCTVRVGDTEGGEREMGLEGAGHPAALGLAAAKKDRRGGASHGEDEKAEVEDVGA
jgi:hypothetical protein